MRTTIDRAGRVVIPKSIRDRAGLHAGATLEVAYRNGLVEITLAEKPSNVRLVKRGRFLVAEPIDPVPPLTAGDVDRVIKELRGERRYR